MTDLNRPASLDDHFGALLCYAKSDVVKQVGDQTQIVQIGAVNLSTAGWPGWPLGLACTESVIEMFVARGNAVQATSDNQPFVSVWEPLAVWMNEQVRSALAAVGVVFDGDAYVTASITPTTQLEGLPHMDDDMFMPDDNVSVVAIIGEHAGPRVATGALAHGALRPASQVTFDDRQLDDFAAGRMDHCTAEADELVLFAQFGQLHAGPAAAEMDCDDPPTRQLLVLRARCKRAR